MERITMSIDERLARDFDELSHGAVVPGSRRHAHSVSGKALQWRPDTLSPLAGPHHRPPVSCWIAIFAMLALALLPSVSHAAAAARSGLSGRSARHWARGTRRGRCRSRRRAGTGHVISSIARTRPVDPSLERTAGGLASSPSPQPRPTRLAAWRSGRSNSAWRSPAAAGLRVWSDAVTVRQRPSCRMRAERALTFGGRTAPFERAAAFGRDAHRPSAVSATALGPARPCPRPRAHCMERRRRPQTPTPRPIMNDTPYWNGPRGANWGRWWALRPCSGPWWPRSQPGALSSPDAVVEREACPACIVRASLSPQGLDAAQVCVGSPRRSEPVKPNVTRPNAKPALTLLAALFASICERHGR